MTNFLVIEVQIWLFLLLLFLVLAGLAVGAYFGWRYLRRREAALRESIETAASEDSLAKRNRMLIRLDHELKNPLTALRTSAASIRDVVREGGTITEVESRPNRSTSPLAESPASWPTCANSPTSRPASSNTPESISIRSSTRPSRTPRRHRALRTG
ncbi:MAG: hypothetical protein L0I80_01670 [Brevibacterium sp.]|nr:hypothetical protein [Brevibacterium sp.]